MAGGLCAHSAAGCGAQLHPAWQGHLLPSSGLAATAPGQSPQKGPSCIRCPSVCVSGDRFGALSWATCEEQHPAHLPVPHGASSLAAHGRIMVWIGKRDQSGWTCLLCTVRQLLPLPTSRWCPLGRLRWEALAAGARGRTGSTHLPMLSQQSPGNQLSTSPSCQEIRPERWGSAEGLSPELWQGRQR